MNTFRSPTPSVGLLNTAQNMVSPLTNRVNATINATMGPKGTGGPTQAQLFLLGILTVLLILLAVFWKQVRDGLRKAYQYIRELFGAKEQPPSVTPPDLPETPPITQQPIPPQTNTEDKHAMVEKILPGRKEVFNVSKNVFSYYDAEPLCKALGAELATYDQVKDAYEKGADWCNYGWTKGQMAVYPTQESTWKMLQDGPEEQRNACGYRPGVNGGYFDNPDLRFGVNCYGQKPDQTNHDATAVTAGEGAPLTPEGLEFERKVAKYRGDANSIGILPFNKVQWAN